MDFSGICYACAFSFYRSHLVSVSAFDCIYFLTDMICFSLVANLVFVFQSSFLPQEQFGCLCGGSVDMKDGCNLQLLQGALVPHGLMPICDTGDSALTSLLTTNDISQGCFCSNTCPYNDLIMFFVRVCPSSDLLL